MNKPTLVLYFPYHTVGGVSVLFLRIAKLFSDSHRIILMDYADGYMAKNIPNGVEFLEYQRKADIPNDSLIVFQGGYPSRIKNFKQFPKSCKVVFWHLHPDNFSPFYKYHTHKYFKYISFLLSFLKLRVGKKLLKDLLFHNSLFFMDKTNFDSTNNYFSLNLNPEKQNHLKIFTEYPENIYKIDTKQKERTLSFGWIGRLEDFKTEILLHTLKRLQNLNFNRFKFEIIGSGKDSVIFRDFKDNCKEYSISIIDEVNPNKISHYISRFDLLFAMGTSALEGAKLGVPTILLDYSYSPIHGLYKYEYIYEKEGLSSGEPITKKNMESSCSLFNKIMFVLEENEKVSSDCKKYWEKNFSPTVFKDEFHRLISKTSLTVGDLLDKSFDKHDFITKFFFLLYHLSRKNDMNSAWN